MTGVSGIVLAAGQSTRLGRPKQLLELDGRPILDIVVDHAHRSQLSEIVLVLGSDADRIAAALGSYGQNVVINPNFAAGQSTSLRTGLGAVAASSSAAIVLLGDQPQVTPEIIDAVIGAYQSTESEIVMPSYGGTPGNPVLFARNLFSVLLTITGDRGARDVINAKRDAVLRVPFPNLTPPLDVDTEDDYAILQAAWADRAAERP